MAPSVVTISPTGDPTGVDDRQAINESIVSVGDGGVVQLAPGQWLVDEPATLLNGAELAGLGGGVNGRTARLYGRTVLSPAPGFTGGALVDVLDGTSGPKVSGIAVRGYIGMPPDVDGIACHGNVNALQVERVSLAFLTGHGIAWFQVNGVDSGACKLDKVMAQQVGKNGVHRWPSDGTLENVHTQYAGSISGTYTEPLAAGTGYGFYSGAQGGNATLIGCRADLSAAAGFYLDHHGSFGDAIRLDHCGTERNRGDGVLVANSSPSGAESRVPVIITGCSLEGDGADGRDAAAVRVQGRNQVYIDNTVSAVSVTDFAAGAPRTGLWLQQAGTGGTEPEVVSWASGRVNYADRGEAVRNHSYGLLQFGSTLVQVKGYEGTEFMPRSGIVKTVNRQAVVSSPWLFASSPLFLTPINPTSMGSVYVVSRSDGQAVVAAESGDGLIAWHL
jgi:hypothetical protein